MRKALNVLQACHAAYPVTDEDAVYTCTGNPHPRDIETVVNSMMSDEFGTCYQSACSCCLVFKIKSSTAPLSTSRVLLVLNSCPFDSSCWDLALISLALPPPLTLPPTLRILDIYFLILTFSVINAIKVERGLALQDLIAGAYDNIQDLELPAQSRVYLLDQLAQIE